MMKVRANMSNGNDKLIAALKEYYGEVGLIYPWDLIKIIPKHKLKKFVKLVKVNIKEAKMLHFSTLLGGGPNTKVFAILDRSLGGFITADGTRRIPDDPKEMFAVADFFEAYQSLKESYVYHFMVEVYKKLKEENETLCMVE